MKEEKQKISSSSHIHVYEWGITGHPRSQSTKKFFLPHYQDIKGKNSRLLQWSFPYYVTRILLILNSPPPHHFVIYSCYHLRPTPLTDDIICKWSLSIRLYNHGQKNFTFLCDDKYSSNWSKWISDISKLIRRNWIFRIWNHF